MLDIFKYINVPKTIRQEKKWTVPKWLHIPKDFWSKYQVFVVSKSLDIHKDFWTISSDKIVQYFYIVYTLKALFSKNWFLSFSSSSDIQTCLLGC